jgi:hypothetical protein
VQDDAADAADARRRFEQLPERYRAAVREGEASVHRLWASWWLLRQDEQGRDLSAFARAVLASRVPVQEALTSDTPVHDVRRYTARLHEGTLTSIVDWRRVRLLLKHEDETPA